MRCFGVDGVLLVDRALLLDRVHDWMCFRNSSRRTRAPQREQIVFAGGGGVFDAGMMVSSCDEWLLDTAMLWGRACILRTEGLITCRTLQ